MCPQECIRGVKRHVLRYCRAMHMGASAASPSGFGRATFLQNSNISATLRPICPHGHFCNFKAEIATFLPTDYPPSVAVCANQNQVATASIFKLKILAILSKLWKRGRGTRARPRPDRPRERASRNSWGRVRRAEARVRRLSTLTFS